MAYKRKTRDVWNIEANYGYGHGWEVEYSEYSFREAKERIKEYRENCPQYPVRIIKKRERIEDLT